MRWRRSPIQVISSMSTPPHPSVSPNGTEDWIGPIKGYFPTPDMAYFFKPTSNTGAKNWLTSDIPKSAGHSTLYTKRLKNVCTFEKGVFCLLYWQQMLCRFPAWSLVLSHSPNWFMLSGLDCLHSNSTLETVILKFTFGIAKNLKSTLNIHTPFMGPLNGVLLLTKTVPRTNQCTL